VPEAAAPPGSLLDPRVRGVLSRYTLSSAFLARGVGEETVRESGQSLEFHDFRPYQPGDELRYVDWNSYARTGRLYTRLYKAEANVNLHLLLDTSPSMDLGGKAQWGRLLGEMLAVVDGRATRTRFHTGAEGAGAVSTLLDFAAGLAPASGPGLVVFLSDLFDEEPLQRALVALRARRLDVLFLQTLAPEDLDPQPGQWQVVDAESGEQLEVGPAQVNAYRQAVDGFIARLRAQVRSVGYRHLVARVPDGERPVQQEALRLLTESGILRRR